MTLLAIVVAAVALFIVVARLRWRRACREGAAKIHREVTAMFAGEHEYAVVDPSDFPGVTKTGYQEVGTFLTNSGFLYLGSVENLTASRVHPEMRTFEDMYFSAEEPISAATYHVGGRQTVDFGTIIKPGGYLLTTNADLNKLQPPPEVDKETLPYGTPLDELLATHLERLSATRSRSPDARCVRYRSLQDAIAASRTYSRIQSRHRRALGFLTEDEMLSFAQRYDQESTARAVWLEFKKLQRSSTGEHGDDADKVRDG